MFFLKQVLIGNVIFLLMLACSSSAYSHALAPSLLQLKETDNGMYFFWKTPVKNNGFPLSPQLPHSCQFKTAPDMKVDGQSFILSGYLSCPSENLIGESIGITNIEKNISPVLVRYKRIDNTVVSHLINAEDTAFVVPKKTTTRQMMSEYLSLGVEHLLTGYDHVLFVIAMLLLIKPLGMLVKAVTCFTLGHSISLALSAYKVVTLPTGIVEILIAASIAIMALEVCRKTAEKSLFERHVWILASLFGVLHGLGFASVLSSFQLPKQELVMALFSFNVGIELGQLLVITLSLFLRQLITMVKANDYVVVVHAPRYIAYVFGSVSAFWVIERTQLWLLG